MRQLSGRDSSIGRATCSSHSFGRKLLISLRHSAWVVLQHVLHPCDWSKRHITEESAALAERLWVKSWVSIVWSKGLSGPCCWPSGRKSRVARVSDRVVKKGPSGISQVLARPSWSCRTRTPHLDKQASSTFARHVLNFRGPRLS